MSESSAHTIALALSLAAENQAHLTLLHVIESAPELSLLDYPRPLLSSPPRQDLMQLVGRQLQSAVPQEARSWREIEERVELGTPYKKILERAAGTSAA